MMVLVFLYNQSAVATADSAIEYNDRCRYESDYRAREIIKRCFELSFILFDKEQRMDVYPKLDTCDLSIKDLRDLFLRHKDLHVMIL